MGKTITSSTIPCRRSCRAKSSTNIQTSRLSDSIYHILVDVTKKIRHPPIDTIKDRPPTSRRPRPRPVVSTKAGSESIRYGKPGAIYRLVSTQISSRSTRIDGAGTRACPKMSQLSAESSDVAGSKFMNRTPAYMSSNCQETQRWYMYVWPDISRASRTFPMEPWSRARPRKPANRMKASNREFRRRPKGSRMMIVP